MVKKLRCVVEGNDWIKAKPFYEDKEVTISFRESGHRGCILLTPADARKLRKQIKKALEAIEGVEEEEEEPKPKDPRFPDWFQPGAIVEITGNRNNHGFVFGEKVRVRQERLSEDAAVRCEYLDGHDYWWVKPSDCKPA